MEKQFKDKRTGTVIHAPLGASLIHATMRNCDLVPTFLKALRDTAEYAQIMISLNGSNWILNIVTEADASDNDPRWNNENMTWFVEDLFDIFNRYAPVGYYFGAHPGDGSDYGYWPIELLN